MNPKAAGELMAKLARGQKPDPRGQPIFYGNAAAKGRIHHVDHHLSHAAASWLFRDAGVEEESLYVVLDGWGVKANLGGGFYSVGKIASTGIVELESSRLPKERYATSFRLDHVKLPGTGPLGVAGKLMGLAGYVPDAAPRPFGSFDLAALERRFHELGDALDEALARDYASLYLSYIEDLKPEIERILGAHAERNVVVGGGTFLALELNTFIAGQGRNVVFGPAANDSGIALGAAALGYMLVRGRWPARLETPFLEWCPPQEPTPALSPEGAAELLVDRNRPIGLIVGQAEIGPRALGHRSLLAVPTDANRILLSETIKRRESYRPVAPIVTDRDFARLFTGPRGRFMQYRNGCLDLARQLAPGIVHRDGTARAQVLSRDGNPWLYDVLVAVGKKTGAECLINTSLNGPGRPIANTADDVRAEMDTGLFELVVIA